MVSRSRHDDVQWGASYLTFLGQKIYEVSSALHNGVKANVMSHLASLTEPRRALQPKGTYSRVRNKHSPACVFQKS